MTTALLAFIALMLADQHPRYARANAVLVAVGWAAWAWLPVGWAYLQDSPAQLAAAILVTVCAFAALARLVLWLLPTPPQRAR